jgi:hypothetical protein
MSLRSILLKILQAAAILLVASISLLILIYGIGTSIVVPLKSAKDDVAFGRLIGTSYRLTVDFEVRGITDDLNKRSLAYQVVYPASKAGYSNRYVIYRRSMVAGTGLRMTDVLVSEWPLVASRTIYVLSAGEEHFQLDSDWFKREFLVPLPPTTPNSAVVKDKLKPYGESGYHKESK